MKSIIFHQKKKNEEHYFIQDLPLDQGGHSPQTTQNIINLYMLFCKTGNS